MNTDPALRTPEQREQDARAAKIYDLAWELGVLMREHADDRWSGWKEYDTTRTLVGMMLESTRRTIRAGFANADAFADAE